MQNRNGVASFAEWFGPSVPGHLVDWRLLKVFMQTGKKVCSLTVAARLFQTLKAIARIRRFDHGTHLVVGRFSWASFEPFA